MSASTFPVRPAVEDMSQATAAFAWALHGDVGQTTTHLAGLDTQQLARVEFACALLTAGAAWRRDQLRGEEISQRAADFIVDVMMYDGQLRGYGPVTS